MRPLSSIRFKPLLLQVTLWLTILLLVGGLMELTALWLRPEHAFIATQHPAITLHDQPPIISEPFGDVNAVGRIAYREQPARYQSESDTTIARVSYACFNASGTTSNGTWEFEFPGEPLNVMARLHTNLKVVVEQYASAAAYYGESIRVIVNRLDTDGSVLSVSRVYLPLDPMYAGAAFEHHFLSYAGEIDTGTYKQRAIAISINLSQQSRQYLEQLKSGTLPDDPLPADKPFMQQPYGVVFVPEQQSEWAEPFAVVPMPGYTRMYPSSPYGWECLYMLAGGGNHGWYCLRDEEAPEAPDYEAMLAEYLDNQPDGFVLPDEFAILPKRPHALLAEPDALPEGYAAVLETYLEQRKEYYLNYADDTRNILYLMNAHNRRFDDVLVAFEHDEANSAFAQIRLNRGFNVIVEPPASSNRAVAISFNAVAAIPEALTYTTETDVRPPFVWRMAPEGGKFIELPAVPATFINYENLNHLLGFTSINRDKTATQVVQPDLLAAPELVWWSGETAPGKTLELYAGIVSSQGGESCVAFSGDHNNLIVFGEDGRVLLDHPVQHLLPLMLHPVEHIRPHYSAPLPGSHLWFSATAGGENLLLSLKANSLHIPAWQGVRSGVWLALLTVLLTSIIIASLRFRHQEELNVVFLLVDGVRSNRLLAKAGNRQGGSVIRRILRRFRHLVRGHFPVLINKYEGDGLKLLAARPQALSTVIPPVYRALQQINGENEEQLKFRLLASVCHATIYPGIFRQADFASRDIGTQCHLESALKHRYPGQPFICLDWALYSALPDDLKTGYEWQELEIELPAASQPQRIALLFIGNRGMVENVLTANKASS